MNDCKNITEHKVKTFMAGYPEGNECFTAHSLT